MSNDEEKAGFGWLLKMALRDGKASGKKLTLFMASIVLGIAAVVSIQSFGENLKDNINMQSREMMGADFRIETDQPPTDRVVEIIDSLGGADARAINFSSMVAFPSGGTKLVQVAGLDGGFPFYGKLVTRPASAANNYQHTGGALVDATLMSQYNLQPGDSIKVGEKTLEISGSLESVPGRSAVVSTMAPPVFIPYRALNETGLMQRGSRLERQFYFVAEPGQDMKKLGNALGTVLDVEGADIDTHSSTGRRMGDNYENFGRFLNLVAFVALLLGCVGIASSIQIYVRDKLRMVAVLRCVGATRRQTFNIYLWQIALMGLAASIAGIIIGIGFQHLLPQMVKEFLPVDVAITLSWSSIIMGLLLGVGMSVLFALIPLMSIWYVSPLQALRVSDEPRRGPSRTRNIILFAILLFIFLFSLWVLHNWLYALSFVSALLVVFGVLSAIAFLLMKGVIRYFPIGLGFPARQSLRNLFRPQNQTLILIVAIGVGAFVISTLYFTKDFLLDKTSLQTSDNDANIIVFNVQDGQTKGVADIVHVQGLPVIDQLPIVTMRVHSINDVSSTRLRNDSSGTVDRWVLNHEFRVTYRDSLTPTESIKAGEWHKNGGEDELYISVDENFASDANVDVGDRVTFNVQGMLMDTRVGSIRKVNWATMGLNFSLVFPTGVLENAPKFHVVTTRVSGNKASGRLQEKLVGAYPNVSVIDLRQMLAMVQDIIQKISFVISFMAFFSIITGIVVLIGAVKTSKYQRIRESVLLRTLGARNRQVLKIVALEYLYLGLLGSLSGILLSLASGYLLAFFAFDTTFTPSLIPFLVLFPGITALVVIIGLTNSRKVIKSPPLEVLRKEA